MKKESIELIRLILKQDKFATPLLRKRLTSWLQMRIHELNCNVIYHRVMSTDEVCALLKCSVHTADRLMNQRRLCSFLSSGTRRMGFWGESIISFMIGDTDKRIREIHRQRGLKRGLTIQKEKSSLPVPLRSYKIQSLSERTIKLILAVLWQDEDYDSEVAEAVFEMLEKTPWRFSIPKRFFCLMKHKEVCSVLKLQSTAVNSLIRERKILPIIGSGDRAMGYSGLSVWKLLLERQ